MAGIYRQYGRNKLCLVAVAFILVALGIFIYVAGGFSIVAYPYELNVPKGDDQRQMNSSSQFEKHYMMYPLQVDSLPKVVSALIDGRNSGEQPINNIYNNSFAVHPTLRCTRPLGILVIIKTCYQNIEKRIALRQTWANSKYLSKFDVPIEYAFILGHGIYNASSAEEELMEEVTKEGDIIIANFVDTYRNNTFKSMAGLFWSIQHCKDYEFLLMVDDDMYLSLHNVIKFLRHPNSYPKSKKYKIRGKYSFQLSGKEIFWGGFIYSEPVHPKRDPTDKWFVTWDEYPFKTFPSVVPGGAILYSKNITQQFVWASLFVKHLNLDDVYLSLIAAKLYIKPFRMNEFVLNTWNWKRGNQNQEKNAIAVHGLPSCPMLIEFWKKYEH